MSKKRKEVSQSTTLLDFFGKGGPVTNKKPKTQIPRQDRSKNVPVKRERFSVAPEDIIVIDSDDENENDVALRSYAPDASSDVELVDCPTLAHSRPLSPHSTNSRQDAPHGRSFLKADLNQLQPAEVSNESFGEPSLLSTSRNRAISAEFSGAFGTPTLLLPQQPSSLGNSDTRNNESLSEEETNVAMDGPSPFTPAKRDVPREQATAVGTPSHEIPDFNVNSQKGPDVIDISDDEWGTGDDEMALVEAELDPGTDSPYGQADIDLTLDEDVEDQNVEDSSCPICGFIFDEISTEDIRAHVNTCLDGDPRPSRLKGSTPSRPLRTLSSLRAQSLEAMVSLRASVDIDLCEETEDVKPGGSNAFSVIMNGYKENEAWKEASVAENPNFRPAKGNGGRRKAPFYKVMTGMPIAVDAFRYGTIPGVTAYFLTHAHSDHYTNLSTNWKSGPIYCSEGTANLIKHMLGVDPQWVHPLPMDVPTIIPNTGGVQVTLLEANHCPGSCLFLFEGKQTVNAGDSAYKSHFVGSSRVFRYLHCGDFRASPQHVLHPAVKGKRLDHVYLDTTYLDPRYCFPPQPQVISACAELARRLVTGSPVHNTGNGMIRNMTGWFVKKEEPSNKGVPPSQGKTLVVVGTYSIGKERIVKAIAKTLQTKVYCDSRKIAILRCQSDPELHDLLTTDPIEAGVHLVPLGVIASDKLKLYVERWKGHFTKAVGFRPTGWTYSQPNGSEALPSIATVISRSQQRMFTYANLNPMKNSTTALQVYGVPYSEHSSFFELTCFALSLDWGRMIATVNVGSELSRGKMAKWVEKWETEKKKRGKIEVISYRQSDYW